MKQLLCQNYWKCHFKLSSDYVDEIHLEHEFSCLKSVTVLKISPYDYENILFFKKTGDFPLEKEYSMNIAVIFLLWHLYSSEYEWSST